MDKPIQDTDTIWDVIVIGTGMGGGTVGYSLAQQGRKVLFLERGLAELASERASREVEDPADRMRIGQWPERVTNIIDDRRTDAFPAMGCGVGGSTKLYAAALERFERTDFEPPENSPHPAGAWPITYDQMAPYYSRAEELLAVLGTRDPLGEKDSPDRPRPPPAAPVDGVFLRDFARAGLHPYRLHVGIAYAPGCQECLGHVCLRACKSDTAHKCVAPALASGHAELRTECEVLRIESEGRTATGVIYRQHEQDYRVRGRIVILSAGSLRSAGLLLLSANADHPAGLANSSGQVGRNLMFHATDWLAIWPSRKASAKGPRKTISLRDFYLLDGKRLGSLQSTGLLAGYGNILMFLYRSFDESRWRWLKPVRPFLRIPAKIAAKLFGNASIFALILEDLPYPENRVEVDPANPGKIQVRYKMHDELIERSQIARQAIDKALKNTRRYWLHQRITLNSGHPCGTCRYGTDPATSVLDPDCRAHDVDNLFVVDAAFMPSSAGANPSLTIAANALRVADAIGRQLDRVGSAQPDLALDPLLQG
jgi:choline dehydrogenase-like flavoprotein